ncbi:MAG: site-specific integrase [Oscillospiraceae bacterium]|nr:site-specific integrase [Oscillospiraceae bacterium]
MTGLEWSAIDFDKRIIKVKQQLIYDSKAKVKLYVSGTTKNGNDRDVKIPQRVIDLLAEYREYQQQEFKRNGWKKNINMVFTDYRADGLIPKHSLDDWFKSFCKRYGLRHLSPHSFRHFYATTLYNETEKPAMVAQQIGDKLSTVIKYYVHAEDDSMDIACETITGVIEGAMKNNGVTLGY